MIEKKNTKLKIVIPTLAAVIVTCAGIATYGILTRHASAEQAPNKNTATFDFDSSKAPGWFAGANINGTAPYPEQAPDSIKMATTTRIITQGTAEKPIGDCFVQYFYWANSDKAPAEVLNTLSANSDNSTPGSYTLVPTATANLTINTGAGKTPFVLHQYNVTGPDAAQMSDGEEFGVLKAGSGYIDIRGYCKTADQLELTLPVLSAVSFKL